MEITLNEKGKKQQFYKGKRFLLHKGERYFSRGNIRMHVYVWEDVHGIKVPPGHHVHHKNENTYDNRPENLELRSKNSHLVQHGVERHRDNPEWAKSFQEKGIKAAPEWHKSPEGLEWHRKHAMDTGFGKFTYPVKPCEQCHNEYEPKTKFSKFCSNKCKSANRRDLGLDNIEKKCVLCGKAFQCKKYGKQVKCSRSCKKAVLDE